MDINKYLIQLKKTSESRMSFECSLYIDVDPEEESVLNTTCMTCLFESIFESHLATVVMSCMYKIQILILEISTKMNILYQDSIGLLLLIVIG